MTSVDLQPAPRRATRPAVSTARSTVAALFAVAALLAVVVLALGPGLASATAAAAGPTDVTTDPAPTSTTVTTTGPTTSTTASPTTTAGGTTTPSTTTLPVATASPTTTATGTTSTTVAGQTDEADAIADPSIVRNGPSWVVYSTQRLSNGTATLNVPMQVSADLTTWTNAGDALPTLPSWAVSGGTWAPSAIGLANGTYVLYFAARSVAGSECIGVGTAATPLGPFNSTSTTPLECQAALGGSIDPDVFTDGHGGLWLAWKNDGNSIGAPDALWSQALTPDGVALAGSPSQLLTSTAGWQRGVIENPDLVTLGDALYLFYSGAGYASSSYATGYATCASPAGPCTNRSTRRPMAPDSWAVGNGSLSTFALPDGRTGIAWSAWLAGQVGGTGQSRSLYIGHLRLVSGVPELIGGLAPDPVLPPPTTAAAPAPVVAPTVVATAAPPSTVEPASRAADPARLAAGTPRSAGPPWLVVAAALAAASAALAALRLRISRRRGPDRGTPAPRLDLWADGSRGPQGPGEVGPSSGSAAEALLDQLPGDLGADQRGQQGGQDADAAQAGQPGQPDVVPEVEPVGA